MENNLTEAHPFPTPFLCFPDGIHIITCYGSHIDDVLNLSFNCLAVLDADVGLS